jgi:hypothetical protein
LTFFHSGHNIIKEENSTTSQEVIQRQQVYWEWKLQTADHWRKQNRESIALSFMRIPSHRQDRESNSSDELPRYESLFHMRNAWETDKTETGLRGKNRRTKGNGMNETNEMWDVFYVAAFSFCMISFYILLMYAGSHGMQKTKCLCKSARV